MANEFPMFDGPSPAAQEIVDDAAPRKRERITVNEAAAQGRCICEGCRACRGKPNYPCATLINLPEVKPDGLCRHCRRDRAKARREMNRYA